MEHNYGIKWVSHPIEEVVKEEKDGCCGGGEEVRNCEESQRRAGNTIIALEMQLLY